MARMQIKFERRCRCGIPAEVETLGSTKSAAGLGVLTPEASGGRSPQSNATRAAELKLGPPEDKTAQAEVAVKKLASSHSEGLGLPEESAFSWIW
jgi:hypothetical protein